LPDFLGEGFFVFGFWQFHCYECQGINILARGILFNFGGMNFNGLQKALSDSFGKGFCFGILYCRMADEVSLRLI
jgi:hypothetical protein